MRRLPGSPEFRREPGRTPRITSPSAPPRRGGEHWQATDRGPCTKGTRTAGTWSANPESPHCAAPPAPHEPGRTSGRRRTTPAESCAPSRARTTIRAERPPVLQPPAHAVTHPLFVSLGRCHGGNHRPRKWRLCSSFPSWTKDHERQAAAHSVNKARASAPNSAYPSSAENSSTCISMSRGSLRITTPVVFSTVARVLS